MCRGKLKECLSVDADAVASGKVESSTCNRTFDWLIAGNEQSSQCGAARCQAGQDCVVTKCPTWQGCEVPYSSSPVCVNLATIKKCANFNDCGGSDWTCQTHAQFGGNQTAVGLGMAHDLQPRGFCWKN